MRNLMTLINNQVDNAEDPACCTKPGTTYCSYCDVPIRENSPYCHDDLDFCNMFCLKTWRESNRIRFEIQLQGHEISCRIRVSAVDEKEAKELALSQLSCKSRVSLKIKYVQEI